MNNRAIQSYDTTQCNIYYDSDQKYRELMRTIFGMDCSAMNIQDDIDDVTRDEMTYDETTMSKVMENLFVATKHNQLFQTLYDLAAAKMFSVDRTIGQCVLFSFDNWALFHRCLCVFLNTPNEFTENHEAYCQMLEKIK